MITTVTLQLTPTVTRVSCAITLAKNEQSVIMQYHYNHKEVMPNIREVFERKGIVANLLTHSIAKCDELKEKAKKTT